MKKLLLLTIILLSMMPGWAFAALSVDASVQTSNSAQSSNQTISTSNANDIILIMAANGGNSGIAGDGSSIATITDTAGLTYTKRSLVTFESNGRAIEMWWAYAPSPLSSDVVTVTYGSAVGSAWSPRWAIVAITGANTTTPFDVNGSLPATVTKSTAVTSASVTVSTTNPNTMLVGLYGGDATYSVLTRPTGFTQIIASGTVTDFANSIVSSAQSSVTETYSWTGTTANNAVIVDAIQASSTASSSSLFFQGAP